MRCRVCGQDKPETDFYVSQGKRCTICKACNKQAFYDWNKKQTEKRRERRDAEAVVGGWRIAILNHNKVNESKYQAVNTNGKSFFTSDKGEFLQFLLEIV